MKSKFQELNESMQIKCNYDLLNFIEMHDENKIIDLILDFSNEKNTNVNIVILNNKSNNKKINIIAKLGNQSSEANIFVSCLGLDNSNTNITIDGIANENCFNSKINIKINGIIDSDNSIITGLPRFFFNTSDVDAKHSLSIGTVNKNQLLYLMSRGINEKQAKYLLIESKLFSCLNSLDESQKQIYKDKILSIWGINNA